MVNDEQLTGRGHLTVAGAAIFVHGLLLSERQRVTGLIRLWTHTTIP